MSGFSALRQQWNGPNDPSPNSELTHLVRIRLHPDVLGQTRTRSTVGIFCCHVQLCALLDEQTLYKAWNAKVGVRGGICIWNAAYIYLVTHGVVGEERADRWCFCPTWISIITLTGTSLRKYMGSAVLTLMITTYRIAPLHSVLFALLILRYNYYSFIKTYMGMTPVTNVAAYQYRNTIAKLNLFRYVARFLLFFQSSSSFCKVPCALCYNCYWGALIVQIKDLHLLKQRILTEVTVACWLCEYRTVNAWYQIVDAETSKRVPDY